MKSAECGKGALVGRWLEKLKELGLEDDENGGAGIRRRASASLAEAVEKAGVEERKEKIRQFGEVSAQEFKGLAVNLHLYLPRSLQKLSRIFRVLETIQRFNDARGLTTIFIKSVRCIENLVKQRVCVADVERMYQIAPGMFRFKRVSIHHDGSEVDTFVVHVCGEAREFNERLWEYVKECHREFLGRSGYEDCGGKLHPEFDFEGVPLVRRPLFPEDPATSQDAGGEAHVPVKRSACAEEAGRKRASTILERIREKERLRREEFMSKAKQEEDNVMLSKRIKSLFRSENKRAIPVSRVVEALRIFDGASTIGRIVEWDPPAFHTRTMGGVEYLVFNDSGPK